MQDITFGFITGFISDAKWMSERDVLYVSIE